MAAAVKDVNLIPSLRGELERTSRRRAVVGIFDDAPYLVKIGTLNEFGTRIQVDAKMALRLRLLATANNYPTDSLPREGEWFVIPERSFMRATFDECVEMVAREGGKAMAEVAAGERREGYEALRTAGEVLRNAIVDKVASGDFAPNDPLTIAIKGHGRPLIGKTGVLEIPGIGIRLRVVSV